MTIYQVIDEQNHPVYAFLTFENAVDEVEMLNESHDDHYYSVNVVELAES